MEVFWFIPTSGDGHHVGTPVGGRAATYPYLRQIAIAVDDLGYHGALLPTGLGCEDAWVMTASLFSATKRMKFLVAVRPGLLSPSLAARMTATLDRISDGRLAINVVTGGDPIELAGDGIFLEHDARYELTDEFLTIWRRLLNNETVDFEGQHLKVQGAKLMFPPLQTPHPPLYLGGSSLAAMQVTAKHIDVYLTWGEPPQKVAEKIQQLRQLAAQQGKQIRFGIRLHIVVRQTESKAWEAAEEIIQYVDDSAIAVAQERLGRFDSEGQRRMTLLHKGNRKALEVSPNLWAGISLVYGGAGTALVGDPDTVATRLMEYADLGIDTFILSGFPRLEEAYRVAELLFPRLPLDQEPVPVNRQLFSLSALGDMPTRDFQRQSR